MKFVDVLQKESTVYHSTKILEKVDLTWLSLVIGETYVHDCWSNLQDKKLFLGLQQSHGEKDVMKMSKRLYQT